MRYSKYHALGNDYFVLEPDELVDELTPAKIQLLCHRNFCIGSDGILLGPSPTKEADFMVRIYNPDGSEAEKSGNGLRIFSRYLWDQGLVKENPFTILTIGGKVTSQVFAFGKAVTVDMGKVSFDSQRIPVAGPQREVIRETIRVVGRDFTFCAATIGNPHCVIQCDDLSADLARYYGPHIEIESRFPNKTNVQFLKVIDRANIKIEIWERGAGYTLASGSSSSAAAAVAYRLGLCDNKISVHMPGGIIEINIGDDYYISMTGPVTKVSEGIISPELFEVPEKLLNDLLQSN